MEKVISKYIQYHLIANDFIHPNQLGGLKQYSTTDMGLFLTYLIQSGWVKNLQTSMLALDITQFFPSLNHCLILRKAGYDTKISLFFSDYLVDMKTCYLWNGFNSSFFSADIGVGQESALSSILFALFITPIFYIFKKRIKNLNISISFLLFVDNGLFIHQEKSFTSTNGDLFCSYNVISSLLNQFRLVVEYGKIEIFLFSRSYSIFNPPALDLSQTSSPIPHPGDT